MISAQKKGGLVEDVCCDCCIVSESLLDELRVEYGSDAAPSPLKRAFEKPMSFSTALSHSVLSCLDRHRLSDSLEAIRLPINLQLQANAGNRIKHNAEHTRLP